MGTLAVIIVLPTMAPTHAPAEWVFTTTQDLTGYNNSGVAFLLGLLQAGWVLVSLPLASIQHRLLTMRSTYS